MGKCLVRRRLLTVESIPGKTAPRLIHDLSQYDPLHPPSTGFNILNELLFHDEGKKNLLPPPPPVGRNSCRHRWSMKRTQCNVPITQNDYKPDSSTFWYIAAYCSLCRSHLDLLMDYRQEGDRSSSPCSTEDRPLHHFVHDTQSTTYQQQSNSGEATHYGFEWINTNAFHCSTPECPLRLAVIFKPPRLIGDWVDQLTDRCFIKERAEKAIQREPERYEGFAVPPATNVLDVLMTYIRDALHDPNKKGGKIPGNNKRWTVCLGDSCSDLIKYLGFVREGEDWMLPKPDSPADIPSANPLNILLDDVLFELHALIAARPADERRSARFQHVPEAAANPIKSALGCLSYPQWARSRIIDLTKEEDPFYASLGAMSDFDDNLLTFSYDCQLLCDPINVAYYLECLQVLAGGRQSEDLQTKLAIEASQGKISLRDVRDAYHNLGLNIEDYKLTDDTVIGSFQARIMDAPKQEPAMRRDLKIVGQHRLSEKIEMVASQAVTTYEQALFFLDASEDLNDEFITSMVSVKIGDRPSDEPTARHAVTLIANHRKSNALKHWLETGTLGETDMDIDQAYARLDITDRTIDNGTILAAYDFHVQEQSSQVYDLKRALTAIAKSRNSQQLTEFLGTGMHSSEHAPSDWPVGIENIGNTCYLNSLLQFYFTIKPLRDLVLDIDNFKMPIDENSLSSKRVGSRNVSIKEVNRAQRFIDELKKLFLDLITCSKVSIKPEPELARLTLVSSSKEEHIRRQSILSAGRPSLGEINGRSVLGPLGPPPPDQAVPEDTEMPDSTLSEAPDTKVQNEDNQSDKSSDTLIDGAIVVEDTMMSDRGEQDLQQKILEEKENLPRTKEAAEPASQADVHLEPLGETSPSRANQQQPQNPIKPIDQETAGLSINSPNSRKTIPASPAAADASPPNRPPPFPPRPQPDVSDAVKEAEYGAQEDVTEVIANVLFQLQCAIKAESLDESGEQIDKVKELFFGKQKSYTTNRQGTIRAKEEYMSDIKVDVASGPRDIYAALDGAYDVQDVEVAGRLEPQYTTISHLPPILQVMIQRVQFDAEKKTVFKSINHLELKETIYMDRYMDSSDPELMRRRQECWAWKRKLISLEERQSELATSEVSSVCLRR